MCVCVCLCVVVSVFMVYALIKTISFVFNIEILCNQHSCYSNFYSVCMRFYCDKLIRDQINFNTNGCQPHCDANTNFHPTTNNLALQFYRLFSIAKNK